MAVETLNNELEIDKGCVLITEAGHFFGTTDVTMAKAMLIYHHYQKVRKEYDFNFHLFATAAFSLSARICQEDIEIEDIVEYFRSLGKRANPLKDAVSMALLPAKVIEVQLDISHVVFKCPYRAASSKAYYTQPNCDVAHRFVFAYSDQFSLVPEVTELSSVKTLSLKFLNTFYHCRKCISYTPLEIAWAAMYLAFLMYNVQVEKNKLLHKELSASVNINRLQKAVDDMTLITDVATRTCSFTSS